MRGKLAGGLPCVSTILIIYLIRFTILDGKFLDLMVNPESLSVWKCSAVQSEIDVGKNGTAVLSRKRHPAVTR